MIRYRYIIALLFLSSQVSSQNYNSIKSNLIDSVYVLQTDFNLFTTVSIPRIGFEDFFKEHGGSLRIYAKKNSIEKICQLIKDLIIVTDTAELSPMPYDYLKKVVRRKNGNIVFVDIDPLNIRAQMIFFMKGKCKTIWISQAFTDIGNYRYYTSENLIEWLQQFE